MPKDKKKIWNHLKEKEEEYKMPERIIVTGEWRDVGLVKGIKSIQQVVTEVGDGVRQTTETTKIVRKTFIIFIFHPPSPF